MKKEFLIIIPVYNEKEALRDVTISTIKESQDFADILFVNDGSTDGSAEVINQLQDDFPDLKAIHKIKNEGYGASLISGFKYGEYFGYNYLITMDCDNQHQPKDLRKFKNFDRNVDLVSGSRYLKESKAQGIKAPKDRVEINQRITCLLNSSYNWNLTDSFCGYKRYKTSSFKDANFTETGYASPLELWSYAYSKNLNIKEIPVDKIYVNEDRSFGIDLDKKRRRYKYYLKTWKESHKKYSGVFFKKSPCTA
ncbi:MAG: glycosyltransferase family 2 protein [Leptospiraceae bacterium]|nr:glycosyltransferase family 2 protein [Leptospiraceae bacterium]